MLTLDYVIGIDGGGSHTRAVLVNEKLELLAHAEAGPCSMSGTPEAEALTNLLTVIAPLVSEGKSVSALYAGISGGGVPADAERIRMALAEKYPKLPVIRVGSDALNPLYSCIGDADGIAAICGTGAGAYAVVNHQMNRVDLDGYLVGDEGGGYWIGRMLINTALRMQDCRLPRTRLYDRCAKLLDGDIRMSLSRLYRSDHKQFVAAFAPVAFESLEEGDPYAGRILSQAADYLAEDILAAGRFFPERTNRIETILSGSLWHAGDGWMKQCVEKKLDDRFILRIPACDPAFGAAAFALTLIRREPDGEA